MNKQNPWLSRIGNLLFFLVGTTVLLALLSGMAMALAWVARSFGVELHEDSWIGIRGLLLESFILTGIFLVTRTVYKKTTARKGRAIGKWWLSPRMVYSLLNLIYIVVLGDILLRAIRNIFF